MSGPFLVHSMIIFALDLYILNYTIGTIFDLRTKTISMNRNNLIIAGIILFFLSSCCPSCFVRTLTRKFLKSNLDIRSKSSSSRRESLIDERIRASQSMRICLICFSVSCCLARRAVASFCVSKVRLKNALVVRS